ncbi:CPXCG motif-containing cysteine-rich protein [Rubritalea tangerina]|uniref:CPXCG motif-containing cysteine-rich protein n=1 Tax=Rubritalea tangerina TaxID=430798 RepID=UPI003613615C
MCAIQCPSCFEWFEIPRPELAGADFVEIDYDCEVCCRPMLVTVDESGVMARSLDEL